MTRRPPRFVLAVALFCAALASSVQAEIVDRVLAIVAGQIVTLSDAYAALAQRRVDAAPAADPVQAALSWLIDRRIILAEVDRFQPAEPSDSAIDGRLAELERALPAGAQLEAALARVALDVERLREMARDDLRVEAYLAQRFGGVRPSDDDVSRYYQEHKADFQRAGTPLPLADVQEAVRAKVAAERRAQLIGDWTADLRRRADVNVLYQPAQGSGTR